MIKFFKNEFFLFILFGLLSLNKLRLHKTFEVKNIFTQEKFMIWLIFNPGLRTTCYWLQVNMTWACDSIDEWSTWKKVISISSKLEPMIWSPDTGHRCQLTMTWMSNNKGVLYKPKLQQLSAKLLAGVWLSACVTLLPLLLRCCWLW